MALTINSINFRLPNRISRSEVRNVSKKRSVNNTLTVDIMTFPKKTEFEMEFDILTNAQLTALKDWIDTGAYTVIITDPGYTYNASSILSFTGWSEGVAETKRNIKVKVQEI